LTEERMQRIMDSEQLEIVKDAISKVLEKSGISMYEAIALLEELKYNMLTHIQYGDDEE